MDGVAVIARMPAAPGRRDELATALQIALDNAAGEPGTRYYLLHDARDDDDVLWMYELYDTQPDLEAHQGAPSFAELGAAMRPYLGGRPELTFLTPRGGNGA